MGRLWLALVLVIALVAPAFADRPRVPELPHEPIPRPPAPQVTSAYLEIGLHRTSTGLYDVDVLAIEAHFDRNATQVHITVRAANGEESSIVTTPDHLQLAYPDLRASVGTSQLFVSQIDANGVESRRANVEVVAHPRKPPDAPVGLLCALLLMVGAGIGVLVMLVVLFKMRATEAERSRIRSATEPTPLSSDAAEQHIRTVALRALFALVVVTAIVVAALGVDMLIVPIYGSPMLLLVALTSIIRVINAGRAIALLHRPGAAAQTRLDQLEVSARARHVTLRSSPALVERARRHALPRATL